MTYPPKMGNYPGRSGQTPQLPQEGLWLARFMQDRQLFNVESWLSLFPNQIY